MNYTALLTELRLAQDLLSALVDTLDDDNLRTQYHPLLSPPGWHLGHCTWIESYWLQEVIGGDDRFTRPFAALYNPFDSYKPDRGEQLPHADVLLQWTEQMQHMNHALLKRRPPALIEHPLMQDNYMLHFLIQHYSQHYENLMMVLTQHAIRESTDEFEATQPLEPAMPAAERIAVQPGQYRVGGARPVSYDNELPAQQARLGPYSIARRPLSNGNYLAFMQDGGYQRLELWDDAGWQWLQQAGHRHPDHWRQDGNGHWHGIAARGACALSGDDAVHGIAWHEARAVARWAGGRLPHEHQWEVACRLQLLADTGRAWEWCDNAFYPYDGFSPFPYEGYSKTWFDGNHYVLRGGSLYTRPAIRRPSFRNFYQPGLRHIFAGLRPVFDA